MAILKPKNKLWCDHGDASLSRRSDRPKSCSSSSRRAWTLLRRSTIAIAASPAPAPQPPSPPGRAFAPPGPPFRCLRQLFLHRRRRRESAPAERQKCCLWSVRIGRRPRSECCAHAAGTSLSCRSRSLRRPVCRVAVDLLRVSPLSPCDRAALCVRLRLLLTVRLL